MSRITAIRGMNDILPQQTPDWQYLEDCFRQVVKAYGYGEIRFPVLEQTQLFKRSIGEVTDIVEKEMYSFDDRNGDNLSLRPEGTAGCVRAAEQHGLLYNQQQRLWYQGPMFRHERPQKGRYRQFHQFGIEAFGMAGPDIDAEIIEVATSLWQRLDLSAHLKLEVNNVGSSEDRKRYAKELSAWLSKHEKELDEDARRRIHSNPMRVLDSKNPATQTLLAKAPKLEDFISDDSNNHYHGVLSLLDSAGIKHAFNPRLVRGLDYYNNCVYEWSTDILGAQDAVCGGGRYDGLVAQLGGKPTLAAGFAIGVERLVLMLNELKKAPNHQPVDIYLMSVGENLSTQAAELARTIRQKFPELDVLCHCGGGKYDSQLKRAYAQGAKLAIILERDDAGDAPLKQAKLRPLNKSDDTASNTMKVPIGKVAQYLADMIAKAGERPPSGE
ncbi:MAG: histidine--tRNA ligase [Pseudohongiellaceae bacterium]